MKIEGNNLGNDLSTIQGAASDRAGQPNSSANPAGSDAAAPSTTDQVRLSPELQLVQSAAKAAAALPGIRQDVVDAMRAELNAGRIGNDPNALADALINSWVNKE